ncbi:hypothetical protein [Sphingobium sp. CECT 9361]|uniref:hypothetical protein n=1 Tax=Sphingobium sp. CECT 9361 TaxID=2845384 RepID=UPI001E47BECA|nr:hypothetical protein [Sphingobium sp. CECT 9361]
MGRKPQNSANLAAFLHIIDTSRLIKVLQKDTRAIAYLHQLAAPEAIEKAA